MKITDFFKNIYNKTLDIIFPNNIKCILCDEELSIPGEVICEKCKNNDIFNNKNRCQKCDMHIKDGNIICDNCKDKKRHFDKCICPLNYQNLVRKKLLNFKDRNQKYLALPFAELINKRLNDENISYDFIIPVPSHPKSIRKRGYNPAKVLAEQLSNITNKPVLDILVKDKLTKKQKKLNYIERQKNLNNSISIKKDFNLSQIKNKNILIIDDIITTCATIDTCASLFKNVNKIYATAVARNQIK